MLEIVGEAEMQVPEGGGRLSKQDLERSLQNEVLILEEESRIS